MHAYSVPIGPSHAASQIDTPNANAATHLLASPQTGDSQAGIGIGNSHSTTASTLPTLFGTKITWQLLQIIAYQKSQNSYVTVESSCNSQQGCKNTCTRCWSCPVTVQQIYGLFWGPTIHIYFSSQHIQSPTRG